MTAAFYDSIRPLFRKGRLTGSQVEGMESILAETTGMLPSHVAYVMATAFHETGQRMQPVREGFARTNDGAIRAVTGLFNKGIIRTNYALPDPLTGHSYYGRGLVQLTWKSNYARMGSALGLDLVGTPDLVLETDVSTACLVLGMKRGLFRKGHSLSMLPIEPTMGQFVHAREIINGDMARNGLRIAGYAVAFMDAIMAQVTIEVEEPEKEHSLWCQLLDLIGLGDHSATGA